MKRDKRPQASKENKPYMRGMQEIRRSNASGPHTPKTAYKRKPKHKGQGYEQ